MRLNFWTRCLFAHICRQNWAQWKKPCASGGCLLYLLGECVRLTIFLLCASTHSAITHARRFWGVKPASWIVCVTRDRRPKWNSFFVKYCGVIETNRTLVRTFFLSRCLTYLWCIANLRPRLYMCTCARLLCSYCCSWRRPKEISQVVNRLVNLNVL